MRKPRPLVPGSVVRVLAPSSPFDPERLPAGLRLLEDFGLRPLTSKRIFQRDAYLAGPDDARADEFLAAMTTDPVDGILPARGGYGATRLLHRIAARVADLHPRMFMGFSDITALHLLLSQRAGIVSFHGPNLIGLPRLDAPSIARTRAALFGLDRQATFTYAGLTPIVGGLATGRIVAGNLSLLASLAGTPFAASLAGALLVIEEVGEAPYRVDRLLTQLAMQADAARVAGFAFGEFEATDAERPLIDRALRQFAEGLGRPAVMGFPAGHGTVNYPVPEGVAARLDADAGQLAVDEDPYEEGS